MRKQASLLIISALIGLTVFSSCKNDQVPSSLDQSTAFNSWLDSLFDITVNRSPVRQTRYGIKTDYDKWDDLSDVHKDEDITIAKANLKALAKWDTAFLNDQSRLTARMYGDHLRQEINLDQFRRHNYLAHQMRGVHDFIPSFLINYHKISDKKDAEAYIGRIQASEKYLAQAVQQMQKRQDQGVSPPAFVFPIVIESAQNIITGAPFTNGEDCAILGDFKSKINDINLTNEERVNLIDQLTNALNNKLGPGYNQMLKYLKTVQKTATTDDGTWKLPNGDNYYRARLRQMTTTDMTPDEIFDIGMSEVDRIHQEMKGIMKQVNFEGSLQDFFKDMRTNEKFILPNTDEGRQAYIAQTNQMVDRMRVRLDELFITKPKADLVVKRVEEFREKAAGKAFYNRPAPDGSRPGTYYANLYDMTQMPTYQMEALLYHEAIPGHHMQISINQELTDMPKFRRLGAYYTAYSEGWGLYSEYVPKEMGFYEDPYSDFGRLAMELWRSCRLVCDVGIHHKKWPRQKAIDFYKTNTPNPTEDCVKMVNRHIVMPGQATAYKIGQLKILELREQAKKELGKKFDIRAFHEVVLTSGAVPLDVLENLVNDYIKINK